MTKTQKTIITLGVLGATVFGANSALAFGGDHGNKDFRGGDREGLVSSEMRTEWKTEHRAEFENLSTEERQDLREERMAERRGHREEQKQAMADFTGLSVDELKAARQSGESMGDVFAAQGITEAQAEAFITDHATDRIESIAERHSLDASEEQTLRDRIGTFVQNILGKWFGN